jgi:hypothetical protein
MDENINHLMTLGYELKDVKKALMRAVSVDFGSSNFFSNNDVLKAANFLIGD